MAGVTPTFAASGSGNSLTQNCTVSNASGISTCTGALKSTDPGDKILSVTAPINFSGETVSFYTLNLNFTESQFATGTDANTETDTGEKRLQTWTGSAKELDSSIPFADLTGLVGYWKLNGSGNVTTGADDILDFSSQNRHATAFDNATPMTFSSSLMNQGIFFDGSDDYLSVPGFQNADLPNAAVTLAAWVNSAATQTDDHGIIVKSGATYNLSLIIDGGASNRLNCRIRTDSDFRNHNSSILLNNNQWYFLACIWNGSEMLLYIDGYTETQVDLTGSALNLTADTLVIGRRRLTDNRYFHGEIDEATVWNRALSASEIDSIYQRQSGDYGGNQPGYYTSPIHDSQALAGETIEWNTLSWVPLQPYGKNLPGSLGEESAYGENNADNTNLNNGLVGLWSMDGNSGDAIANILDSSTNSNAAAASSANSSLVFADGILGQAASFDGTDDELQLGNPSELQITGALTISAWIRRDNDNAHHCIVAKRGSGGSRSYDLRIGTDNANDKYSVSFRISGDGTNFVFTDSERSISPGVWRHIVGVYDPSSYLRVYIDGLQDSEETASVPASIFNSAQNVFIGSQFTGQDNFDGLIDEVAVWNRALSAAEVLQLYERGISQMKFQVRACSLDDCSDANFVGPDGTGSTFYSESINNSTDLPSFTLTNLAPGRYFQYQATFSTRNSNYTPILQQVSFQGAEQ